MTRSTWVFAAAVVLAATGCDRRPEREYPAAPPGLTSLDEAVRWEREFALEENERTINVVVRATIDPAGGFLIADEREGFVRRYSVDGELLSQFGGKGSGPSEFRNVLGALRLSDRRIAVFDGAYKGAVFDSSGSTLLRTFRTPVGPLHAAMLLDDTLALLGGRVVGEAEDYRLHVWHLKRDSVLRSFFAPALPSEAHRVAAQAAGWVGFDRRGDTLAVVTSLSDTLHLIDLRGTVLERIPIPFRAFRRLDPAMDLPTGSGDIGEARRWLGSFSMVAHVHWLPEGFVIQYQDRVRPQPDWRVLGMSREGRWLFEVVDSPMLVASQPEDGVLYFVSPQSETPNVWRMARLRNSTPARSL